MKIIRMMMISCEKAGKLIEKKSEGEISFRERLQLTFHLRMWEACRLFQHQSKFIRKTIDHIYTISPTKAPRHLKENIMDAIK